MISHLGKMPSLVVGGTWAARRNGEDVLGLSVIGDGGTSTGEFHESLNLAALHRVPVLFIIENNYYSFSTPISAQYTNKQLSDRAKGFDIAARTIDGTDAWGVYSNVCDALATIHAQSAPQVIECLTLRLHGHAVYDNGEYVPDELMKKWRSQDPLPAARQAMQDHGGFSEDALTKIESRVEEEIQEAMTSALKSARPDARRQDSSHSVFAPAKVNKVEPFQSPAVKNGDAIKKAQEYLLSHDPAAFIMGLDVGRYGSAFKTCKGLIDLFGPERVIDMPLCEPALMGFALGASQLGQKPIFEFQFADFSTETATQLGLNASTWYFRTGCAAPILVRLPCGGGLTMGAFHSGEFEGLWSRFPGLKLLYPATAQESFEAIVAGFYDPNPCLVFEHKLLYWSKSGPIDFDGDLSNVWRARRYREGSDLTVVAFGAMVYEALTAAGKTDKSLDVWNPFVLQPMALGPIVESVRKTGRLLVVQECGATQGLGDLVISRITRETFSSLKAAPQLVAAPDAPIPFAPELENDHRPNVEKILAAAEKMFCFGP
jgi:2-oxoisovalerate dehydrogenase E1 component